MVSFRMLPALLVANGLVGLMAAAQEAPKSLSLQEAIQAALENNLQVKISKAQQEQSSLGVLANEGAFDWRLGSTLTMKRNETDASVAEGFDPKLGAYTSTTSSTTLDRSWRVGMDKAFEWGGQASFSVFPTYRYSNTTGTGTASGIDFPVSNNTKRPYNGVWNMSYTQSLLKGFGRQAAAADLMVARKNAESADHTFVKSIIQLVSDTEGLYWDTVQAQRNLENKQKSLELAQKQLRENKIRVEVGTMAPIEVTSAEAAVAQREQEIIAAEATLANTRDALLRTLFPASERPASLVLTDSPTLSRVDVPEDAAQKMALDRRVELKIARNSMESARIQEGAAKQNVLPQLDVTLGYGSTANSGKVFGDVGSDLAKVANPGYSVSVNFAMPIQNKAAKANLSTRRAALRQSELTLKDQELSILLEVRTAMRSVQAAEKGLKAAEKSRIFSERDLEAEQKKFENGMSTNFVVLSKQNALDLARASELQAQIAFAKAVTAIEKAVGNLLEARKLKVQ